MRLTIDAKELAAAVAQCREAIDNRFNRPALGDLFLEAGRNGKLRVTGSNEAMSITKALDASVDQVGSICVPEKQFSDLVSKLSGPITLEVNYVAETDLTPAALGVKTESSRYTLNGIPGEDYPVLPTLEGGQEFTLAAEAIAQGIRFCTPSLSADESKQVLTGINVNLSPTAGLTFASTDGHRLTVCPVAVGDVDGSMLATIPGKAAGLLPKLFPDEGDVGVIFGDVLIQFFDAGTTFISRILEGQYPNYGQLIPVSFANILSLPRKAFLEALTRVMVLASTKNDVVKLEISSSAVTLSADAAEIGSGRESLKGEYSGEDIAIAFNGNYLRDACKIFADEDLILNMNEPTTPVVVRGGGSPNTVLYLLMPIQIRG